MHAADTIVPAAYPQLHRLVSNRGETALTEAEPTLMRELADQFGNGHLLTAW